MKKLSLLFNDVTRLIIVKKTKKMPRASSLNLKSIGRKNVTISATNGIKTTSEFMFKY